MQQWIKEVARGKKGSKDLSYDEASQAAQTMIEGHATDTQIAAFLVGERLKGESTDEVLAFVHQLNKASDQIPLSASVRQKVIDFAGPYNGRHTFAATIPVAILLAERGLPVFLHSSDSLPPKYGVALKDILQELGIAVHVPVETIAASIESLGIGFGWTEQLCPPLAHIRHVREEIGVRSFLNTAEKLLNLTDASAVMVGVFHKTVIDVNSALLRALTYKKAYIVQGAEGSEDLPIHRKSFLYEMTQDAMHSFDLDPNDFGLKHRKDADKEKVSLKQQVQLIERILEGEQTEDLEYYRSQVVFNAAVRYFLFGHTSTVEEGIDIVQKQLRQQRGRTLLKAWRNVQA